MKTLIDYQLSVFTWAKECFGRITATDTKERRNRFTEEAIELVQACGASKADVLKLVDYVYSRPVGERRQEVGGVMVTLSALCSSYKINLELCADTELERIWDKMPQIREKHMTKPRSSPLPGDYPKCSVPPEGWRCTRNAGHGGPCAAVPEVA